MIGSLDENGRKTDLLMAPDVKCTRREPNNTHLLSVIDLANILKFNSGMNLPLSLDIQFLHLRFTCDTEGAVLTKYSLSGGKGSIEFVYNSF